LKNRKITYFILFPAVLIVWGIIAYKIIIAKDQQGITKHPISVPVRKGNKTEGKKEYQLLNNYPDPFFPGKERVPDKKDKNKAPKTQPAGPVYHWPDIRYNGYVLNGNITKAHVTIGEKNRILAVHESFSDGCMLTRITRDSILVWHQNNTRWFRKKP